MSLMNGAKTYVVSYDFTNNKLRRRIDKVLKDYGIRFQRSVFVCHLKSEQLDLLSTQLVDMVKKHSDLGTKSDSLAIIDVAAQINFLTGDACNQSGYLIY